MIQYYFRHSWKISLEFRDSFRKGATEQSIFSIFGRLKSCPQKTHILNSYVSEWTPIFAIFQKKVHEIVGDTFAFTLLLDDIAFEEPRLQFRTN